jgi:hypothetical protein
MNKKLYAFVLTPILFVACANNDVKVEKKATSNMAKKVSQKTITPPQTVEVTKVSKQETVISYVQNPEIAEKGMMHIKGFMGSLKPTLEGLLQSDPKHTTALGACSAMAMGMTDDYNKQVSDVKIRRTALKYRNQKNKPDSADVLVMERFLASGDFKKPLIIDAGNHYRVYKALPTKQSCTICHGAKEQMSPEIVKMIQRRYPNDLATGFKVGDFRGAVVAEVKK